MSLLLRRTLVSLIVLLVLPAVAQAQLQSPSAFLGYDLGTRFTSHHRVLDYVAHVAAHSPNVRTERYGETYEGRPLLVVYVAAAENLARLEEIRTNNLRRAGLAEGTVEGATAALVWLSYNVHGNESVSTEAAMQTLYELADPTNARTQAWLAHTVVILDPCINPDGRERYVQWYNRTVGRTFSADPQAREHREPWPGGRTNHYYFDLNRDWSWGTQQETQQRLALYQRWMPHVHVDFHEQGVDEPYYFAPAAEPYHEDITPWQRQLQSDIGRNHARYFDANGWLYFTRQVFDLLYPGYGDSWPTWHGAVGMTYEQGGSGRAGLAIRTAESDTLTLADRIAHHHTTGLSTVEATAQQWERTLREFQQYFERNRTNPPGPYKTWMIRHTNPPGKLAALVRHLDQQGIQWGLAPATRITQGFDYRTRQQSRVTVQAGDLLVSAYQPKAVLAKVLFEPQTVLADSLTYDITAWALPYAYGLDAYALTERLNPAPPAPATFPPAPALERPYAYVVAWRSFAEARFLAALLQAGIKPRVATKPFTIDAHAYAPGTLVLTRRGHEALGDRFDTLIRTTAARMQQPLHAVASGLVTEGADFGSSDVSFLARPNVALLAGNDISANATGEVWHFFDQQLGYPVTVLDADGLGDVDLDDYDVLILPGGSYRRILAEERLAEVKAWVEAGGRLIALSGAATFLADKEGFHLKRADTPTDSTAVEHPYLDQEREALSSDTPGAIYAVQLDPSHPLAYGYGDTSYTLRLSTQTFEPFDRDKGWNVGILRQHVSGFVGYKAKPRLPDTLVFGVQDMGNGTVVYLADNPLFRGFWHEGLLLFSNAVFMTGR